MWCMEALTKVGRAGEGRRRRQGRRGGGDGLIGGRFCSMSGRAAPRFRARQGDGGEHDRAGSSSMEV